jgi:hypothetical protein
MEHTAYLSLKDDDALIAFGGLVLPTHNVQLAEHLLRVFCRDHAVGNRSMEWDTCLHGGREAGCEFARQFLTLVEFVQPIEFRGMLVPASHLSGALGDGSRRRQGSRELLGHELLRVFLRHAGGISSTPPPTAIRPIVRDADGGVAGRSRQGPGPGTPAPLSRAGRLGELADLLLGALAFRRNDRGERRVGAMGRRLACDAIERALQLRLIENTGPAAPPFSVWTLETPTRDPFVGGVKRPS